MKAYAAMGLLHAGIAVALRTAYVLPGPRRSRRPTPPRDSRCTGSPDEVCRGTLIAVFPPCTSTI